MTLSFHCSGRLSTLLNCQLLASFSSPCLRAGTSASKFKLLAFLVFEETVGPLAKIVELTRKKPCHRVVGLRRTPVRLRRRAIVTDSHGGQQFNTAQLKWDAPLTVTAACTRGGSRPEPEINRVDSITSLLLLHPSPNIKNFNILFVLFNHSSY